MRVLNRITTTAAASLALLVLGAGPAGAPGTRTDDMSRAKAGTAPYHDVNVALADGFVDEDGECTHSPEGGMGLHHVNFDRFDMVLDAAEPEVLLYAPSDDGPRLVGAEYVVAAPIDQAPQLFGHPLEKVQEIGDGLASTSPMPGSGGRTRPAPRRPQPDGHLLVRGSEHRDASEPLRPAGGAPTRLGYGVRMADPAKPQVTVGDGPPPSQLQIDDIEVGSGPEAASGANVDVHYVGVAWSTGQEFDASWNRRSTFSFRLGAGQVIPGWDQGVAGMKVGGRRRLTIPPDLGYGGQGAGGVIKPNETLVFVVDLVDVR